MSLFISSTHRRYPWKQYDSIQVSALQCNVFVKVTKSQLGWRLSGGWITGAHRKPLCSVFISHIGKMNYTHLLCWLKVIYPTNYYYFFWWCSWWYVCLIDSVDVFVSLTLKWRLHIYTNTVHTTQGSNNVHLCMQASHINAKSGTNLMNKAGQKGMMECHAFSEYVYWLWGNSS